MTANYSPQGIFSSLQKGNVEYQTCHNGHDLLRLCCPYCTDTRFRLHMTLSGLGFCHNEQQRRNGWDQLFRQLRISGAEGNDPFWNEPTPQELSLTLPEDFQPLWVPLCSNMDKRALAYLRQRDVSAQQIERYRIGVVWSGRFGYRVVVPLYWKRKLEAFTARDITGQQEPKYLTKGNKLVFSLTERTGHIHLFEGVFKALRAQRALSAECGAIWGSSVTQRQVEQLQEADCRRVTLWPDPDCPGHNGALRSAEALEAVGIRVRIALASRPADDCATDQITGALRESKRWSWGLRMGLMNSALLPAGGSIY